MLFIMEGENLWISMAKLWILLWWFENDLFFLEGHKTMICSRNKQSGCGFGNFEKDM